MPTYEYRCKSCDHGFEIVQSFADDALTACPECGGPLRKVFGNVGITFKGSGFYKTDSRSSSSSGSTTSSGSSDGSSSGGGSSDGGSSTSSDSTSSGSGSSSGSGASDKAGTTSSTS